MPQMTTTGWSFILVGLRTVIFLDACVCEEFIPSVLFSRLLGCSGFGDSSVCVEDDDSENIQEIIFMGGGLMWNDEALCGGRMELKILVRD